MGRIYVEVEDNPNCDYHPMQTFETTSEERLVPELLVPELPGREGPHVVVGWCSDFGERGGPCPVTVVEVTDSGSARSILVAGGDYGLRIKPSQMGGQTGADEVPWYLGDASQWGEPYMLLPPTTAIRPLDVP